MPKKLNFYKFNCDINLRIANAKTTLQLVKPRRDCIKSPEIQKKNYQKIGYIATIKKIIKRPQIFKIIFLDVF